jgi:hypothetical protein
MMMSFVFNKKDAVVVKDGKVFSKNELLSKVVSMIIKGTVTSVSDGHPYFYAISKFLGKHISEVKLSKIEAENVSNKE